MTSIATAVRAYNRSFWAANVSELFERIAFYGVTPMLVVYLTEVRGFSSETAIRIGGNFGMVTYGLPALCGFLADALGYRRALFSAYLLLAAGYFGIGALSSYGGLLASLGIVAFGVALVKPIITGTVQKTCDERQRALGFSLYYTIVNIGGFVGPNLSAQVRAHLGTVHVFSVSAAAVLVGLLTTAVVYREPVSESLQAAPQLADFGRNFLRVLSDARLMLLFVCVAGWWSMFFAFFNVLPLYLRDDLHVPAWLMGLQSLDALAVVTLQVAVGLLVRRLLPVRAVLLAIFISSAGVALMSAAPSVGLAALGVLAFACGEMIYSAHFYQYLGSLAPAGQVGMYMGFAFLPIALGSFLSGQIGAPVVTYFRESLHAPQLMWLVFAGVGAVSALGVFFVARAAQARTGARR